MTGVVIWVQHLLGTGHTVRAAAIAHAFRRRGATVTLVLGARPPATLDLGGLKTVQLPPVLATDASFRTLIGEDGEPYEALKRRRIAAFRKAVADARPDVLVTESFPLGRRRFAEEIVPVLSGLGRGRPLVAASTRDVLVRKSAEKASAMVALARRWFDMILVHADPDFVRLDDSFPQTAAIAGLLVYTGFVREEPPAVPGTDGTGEVVVSAGGGRVGATLAHAAIGAAHLGPSDRLWRILLAPTLAERLEDWRAVAPRNVILEPNRPDFPALLSRAALSVSQAGYNTVLDVLAAGIRAILVPFAAHEETEQTDRAAALRRRGLAHCLEEAMLTPHRLAAVADDALAAPPPLRPSLDLAGAERTADIALKAASRG